MPAAPQARDGRGWLVGCRYQRRPDRSVRRQSEWELVHRRRSSLSRLPARHGAEGETLDRSRKSLLASLEVFAHKATKKKRSPDNEIRIEHVTQHRCSPSEADRRRVYGTGWPAAGPSAFRVGCAR
jgi:hypothetical protein